MSVNFGGTFSKEEFRQLLSFTSARRSEIGNRRVWIAIQIYSTGVMISQKGRDGVPTRVIAKPVGSRLYKLMAAYEAVGGDPLDLYVRPFYDPLIPAGFKDGDINKPPSAVYTDGTVTEIRETNDTLSAAYIRNLKQFMSPAIRYRRQRVEAKVHKAVYFVDKLQKELAMLNQLLGFDGEDKSIQSLVARVQSLIDDDAYPDVGTGT